MLVREGGLGFSKTAHLARISVALGLAVQVDWKVLGTGLAQAWRYCLTSLGVREALSMLEWNAERTCSQL